MTKSPAVPHKSPPESPAHFQKLTDWGPEIKVFGFTHILHWETIGCFFFCSYKQFCSVLYWVSDLLFQNNIPICLGLMSPSADSYFLKVTSSHTNHKQIPPYSTPSSLQKVEIYPRQTDTLQATF